MAIQYSIVERGNPMDRTAPKKFYASAKKRGSMGLEDLAERITEASTASEGDTHLVLIELSNQLRKALVQGYTVKLPGLGSFRVTLNGIGADSVEEFSTHLIRGPKVRFLPEGDLMDKLNRTSLERVTEKPAAGGGTAPDPEPGPGES